MVQKFELNELKENKVIPLPVPQNKRIEHSVHSMTFNGNYASKSVWSIDKKPVLEIVNTVPGGWRIVIKDRKVVGYYFKPKEDSPYRWELKFEY